MDAAELGGFCYSHDHSKSRLVLSDCKTKSGHQIDLIACLKVKRRKIEKDLKEIPSYSRTAVFSPLLSFVIQMARDENTHSLSISGRASGVWGWLGLMRDKALAERRMLCVTANLISRSPASVHRMSEKLAFKSNSLIRFHLFVLSLEQRKAKTRLASVNHATFEQRNSTICV